MANLQIGSEEHIACLQPVATHAPDGASLCLGYKYTFHMFGLPAWVSDDGYVLKVAGSDTYYPLSDQQIHDAQQAGELAQPLPSYSLSTGTYAFGYALWPVVAVAVLLAVWLPRRRAARLRGQRAADAATPVSTVGPAQRTEGDRYIAAQLAPLLHEGEQITHQAYGLNGVFGGRGGGLGSVMRGAAALRGVMAALTSERLFLIDTRVGAFAPLLENHGVEAIERARICVVEQVDARALRFTLVDGSARTIVVDARKRFSNQDAFLRDVPRLVAQRSLSSAAMSGAA